MSSPATEADAPRLEETRPIYSRAPVPLMARPYDLQDRLEILNLLGAYGHLFDGGYREAWLETVFAPQARFILRSEHYGLTEMEGRDGIRRWFADSARVYRQYVERQGLDPAEARVFHWVQNVTVVDQQPDRARVVANQYVGVKHPGLEPTFHYVGNVRIEGVLEKDAGGRWQVVLWDIL